MAAETTIENSFEELRHDLKVFIETRYEMLRTELGSSLNKLRSAAILIATAAVFAVTGLILLGFCISFVIALGFGAFQNQVGLIWGFLITGSGGLMLAGVVGLAGKSRLNAENLAPKRTLQVLKRDQESFQQRGEGYGEQSPPRRRA